MKSNGSFAECGNAKQCCACCNEVDALRAERDRLAAALRDVLDAEQRFENESGCRMVDDVSEAVTRARAALEGVAPAAAPPCGGERCHRADDGTWIHSSKSYGTCSERSTEPIDANAEPAATAEHETEQQRLAREDSDWHAAIDAGVAESLERGRRDAEAVREATTHGGNQGRVARLAARPPADAKPCATCGGRVVLRAHPEDDGEPCPDCAGKRGGR